MPSYKRSNKKRSRKSNKKTFKQKIYNMKGCSKSQKRSKSKAMSNSRSRMQYISKTKGQSKGRGFGQGRGIGFRGGLRGGSCATCPLTGGSSPLVGAPWAVDQTVNSNYYAPNLYAGRDMQTAMQLNGGRRHRNSRRQLRGGGLSDFIPSGITNLGRDLMYNASSAHSSLTGSDAPVNPDATQGHLTASIANNRVII